MEFFSRALLSLADCAGLVGTKPIIGPGCGKSDLGSCGGALEEDALPFFSGEDELGTEGAGRRNPALTRRVFSVRRLRKDLSPESSRSDSSAAHASGKGTGVEPMNMGLRSIIAWRSVRFPSTAPP